MWWFICNEAEITTTTNLRMYLSLYWLHCCREKRQVTGGACGGQMILWGLEFWAQYGIWVCICCLANEQNWHIITFTYCCLNIGVVILTWLLIIPSVQCKLLNIVKCVCLSVQGRVMGWTCSGWIQRQRKQVYGRGCYSPMVNGWRMFYRWECWWWRKTGQSEMYGKLMDTEHVRQSIHTILKHARLFSCITAWDLSS